MEPDPVRQAIAQFNAREFYACHDTLEALWTEASDPVRRFYQGWLQVAVAYYHLGNGNWRGCVILLGEGIRKLEDFCPNYGLIDVQALVTANQTNLNQLQALGADRLSEFDPQQIPAVQLLDYSGNERG